jgi:oligosaccharide 4-alpha-D-glucosyltransferase
MNTLFRLLPIIVIGCLIFSCENQSESQQVPSFELALPKGGTYTFQAFDENVIQVRFANDSIDSDLLYAPKEDGNIPLMYSESEELIELSTGSVRIEIEKEGYQIRYFDGSETLKLTDRGGLQLANDSTYFNFALTETEAIYGTGFRALPLNRRGEKLLIYNRPQYGYGWGEKNLNYTIPHWTSSNNYGLLIDNPARAQLDIGASVSSTLTYASKGGNMTYYFINGSDQKALLAELVGLTGRQPLPPRWSFGNLQSRFGYRSQKQTEEILNKSLDAGYPVDAIILDIYWFGPELEDGQMGKLDWDLEKWPEPKKMIQGFKEKGVKTVVVTEPFFTRKAKHYPYLSEQKLMALNNEGKTYDIPDFYFGVGGLLDVFKPGAKSWMWDQYKYIRSFGVDGLWVDLGEPEKHPHDMIHVNGKASQIHGAYGHEWARMLHEGYQNDYKDERLFHMGRSGFVGSQRFGLIPWTGDVGRGWQGLKAQMPAILSMGISGLGYMHSDAGGFSMIDIGDPELYTRWLQLSTFTSVFRPHADQIVAPEPVFWDEKTQSIVKDLIDLRYSLLPYHYTLAYENSQSGLPFARPMIMEFPEASDTLYQQFMYGADLLVAPVIEPGEISKKVVLPAGQWYDLSTNEKLEGDREFISQAAIEEVPVFVREGAIMPTSPGTRSADSYNGEEVILTYYLSSQDTRRSFFFDDGKDPKSIEKRSYEMLDCAVSATDNQLKFSVTRNGSYEGAPEERKITWRVIGLAKKPVNLPAGSSWNTKKNYLELSTSLTDSHSWELLK